MKFNYKKISMTDSLIVYALINIRQEGFIVLLAIE